MMLSRIADSLLWISRYMERAEETARILDVKYLPAPDYLGYRAAVNKPELRNVVPPAHLIKRTFTFELSNMPGTQKKRGDITLPASGCSTGPAKARPTLEVQT